MARSQVLQMVVLAVAFLVGALSPAASARQFNGLAPLDGDYERYAVRVSRAGDSALSRANRRGRATRGRLMVEDSPVSTGGGCELGLTQCGATCTNLTSSSANCGACSSMCISTEECCGGACTSLSTDAANCGACGNSCPLAFSCQLGLCVEDLVLMGY